MKVHVIASLVFAFLLAGCVSPIAYLSSHPRPYAFVGTVKLGQPIIGKVSVVIPVSYEGGDWLLESSTAMLYGTRVRREGYKILFSTLTSLPGANGQSGPHGIYLPRLKKGRYEVIYLDPDGTRHPVGYVEIDR